MIRHDLSALSNTEYSVYMGLKRPYYMGSEEDPIQFYAMPTWSTPCIRDLDDILGFYDCLDDTYDGVKDVIVVF